ncbi:LLM class flavin-dependent oxidoreductase [Pigmentiphaga aceris]|uniref:LLM class flavin-dependent oxidoreductase n=1 Tax=Pigmentiphaga aceris TaxID=1940612 RepID=A0A5C0AYK9_9BURK|nr:LLM class flavin-dependent oxidoreductase [Pigmentiphaga aceris]QEI06694.1 LLM class flavin-dependent oxidoreductase [Pigmentiphaga aceris]
MSIELNWYLPTHGDFHGLTNNQLRNSSAGVRPASPEYLARTARAIEYAGFNAVLIPTGPTCHDSWVVAAALSRDTTRLKFLVAFRPGFVLPAVAAQTAQSLQRITGNRLLLNVVTGGSSTEQQGYGDFLDHDERYARTGEFLDIVRQVWTQRGVDYSGDHYRLRNGGLLKPLSQTPPIYFGGASAAAEPIAAQFADTYLLWGETPDMVRERIERVDELAAQAGRQLRYGFRAHIIARETEAAAWAEADRLLSEVPRDVIEKSQKQFRASESVGQARMVSLHAGKTINHVRDLEVYPNLWAGVGLVRGGAGTAFVGSYQQVAERIQEFHQLGLSSFILSGYPNLEESLRVGEEVLPLLPISTSVAPTHSTSVTEPLAS